MMRIELMCTVLWLFGFSNAWADAVLAISPSASPARTKALIIVSSRLINYRPYFDAGFSWLSVLLCSQVPSLAVSHRSHPSSR